MNTHIDYQKFPELNFDTIQEHFSEYEIDAYKSIGKWMKLGFSFKHAVAITELSAYKEIIARLEEIEHTLNSFQL